MAHTKLWSRVDAEARVKQAGNLLPDLMSLQAADYDAEVTTDINKVGLGWQPEIWR